MSEQKISSKITEKYDVSPKLGASTHDFGTKYAGAVIDLRNDDHLSKVDSFVAKYPDQKYFTAKGKSSAAPKTGV
jgi:hypothetical protein